MIKRTLYFGNPAYLSLKLGQLVVKMPAQEAKLLGVDEYELVKTLPIEDLGIIVLDHKQITITQALLEQLLENNCAVLTCDSSHLPVGLFLPLCGNTIQNERFRNQLDSSLPLKKQLWQQTIQSKIANQAAVLKFSTGQVHPNMVIMSNSVRSGDVENVEGRAAVYYWRNVFPSRPDFVRGREEAYPNNLLNYGYALLRAIVARALVCSGLLPTLGIHHHNRYNAYCLADDIMEPYRPYVDKLVIEMMGDGLVQEEELTKSMKAKLLSIPSIEVQIDGKRSPLMVAVSVTTASLAKCFAGELRRIVYPEM